MTPEQMQHIIEHYSRLLATAQLELAMANAQLAHPEPVEVPAEDEAPVDA